MCTLAKGWNQFNFKPSNSHLQFINKNGIFHDYWKITLVDLKCQSSKRSDSNNYRPISMLLIFSGVLERILQDQLQEYLKANCTLTNKKYAFRTLYSTILLSLVNSK